MGHVCEPTEAMGEYSVEVRGESFYLHGDDNFERIGDAPCPSGCTVDGAHTHGEWGYVEKRHAIIMYPKSDEVNQGTVEILIEDLPKIRAALDQVEEHVAKRERKPWMSEREQAEMLAEALRSAFELLKPLAKTPGAPETEVWGEALRALDRYDELQAVVPSSLA